MRLNKNGQALVLFIVMFPIIFFLVAFFIESMLISSEKDRLNNIGELAIKYAYKNKDDVDIESKLNSYVTLNDKDIFVKKLDFGTNKIDLVLYKEKNSLFGKIIGLKKYDVVTNYTATIEDTKVTYTRK